MGSGRAPRASTLFARSALWSPTRSIPFQGIGVTTHLNGDLRQNGNTRDLIFPIDFLLRYITAAMTLLPGDLILTGTPAGVGLMQAGDQVSITVEGVGTLTNPVL